MAEVAPPAGGGGANRSFLLIIGGLAALLFIGLLALGAISFLPTLFGSGQIAAVITATPTRILIPATASRTAPASPTLVVVAQITEVPTLTETPPALITATPIPITATPILITATPEATAVISNNELPNSGLGEDLLLLFGGGLLLVGLIIVARRMRST